MKRHLNEFRVWVLIVRRSSKSLMTIIPLKVMLQLLLDGNFYEIVLDFGDIEGERYHVSIFVELPASFRVLLIYFLCGNPHLDSVVLSLRYLLIRVVGVHGPRHCADALSITLFRFAMMRHTSWPGPPLLFFMFGWSFY